MSVQVNKNMNLGDGMLLYDDLRGRAESQVVVGNSEPQTSTTKLWIDTDETGEDYEVPTYREFQTKQDAPSAMGTSGQILKLDDNLNPVWGDSIVVPVFTENENYELECNLTFNEILEAIRAGKCSYAILNPFSQYPGAEKTLPFIIQATFYVDDRIVFQSTNPDIQTYVNLLVISVICYAADEEHGYPEEFYPTMMSMNTQGTPYISRHGGTTITAGLYPYPFIKMFGEKQSITLTLYTASESLTPENTVYKFLFSCPSSSVTSITINGIDNIISVGDKTLQAGHMYEVEIIGGIAIYTDLGVAS